MCPIQVQTNEKKRNMRRRARKTIYSYCTDNRSTRLMNLRSEQVYVNSYFSCLSVSLTVHTDMYK